MLSALATPCQIFGCIFSCLPRCTQIFLEIKMEMSCYCQMMPAVSAVSFRVVKRSLLTTPPSKKKPSRRGGWQRGVCAFLIAHNDNDCSEDWQQIFDRFFLLFLSKSSQRNKLKLTFQQATWTADDCRRRWRVNFSEFQISNGSPKMVALWIINMEPPPLVTSSPLPVAGCSATRMRRFVAATQEIVAIAWPVDTAAAGAPYTV